MTYYLGPEFNEVWVNQAYEPDLKASPGGRHHRIGHENPYELGGRKISGAGSEARGGLDGAEGVRGLKLGRVLEPGEIVRLLWWYGRQLNLESGTWDYWTGPGLDLYRRGACSRRALTTVLPLLG